MNSTVQRLTVDLSHIQIWYIRVSCSLLILLASTTLLSAGQDRRPIPPGIREADRIQAVQDQETPVNPVFRRASGAELQQQANELARLSQQIPGSIQQVNKNVLPKDLNGNLKKIEQLAKKLRNELSQ
jgi:hypothetical protein